MRYPKELKSSIIAKMLPPNNQSLSQIQQETGRLLVPDTNLSTYRLACVVSMAKPYQMRQLLKLVELNSLRMGE